MTCISGFVDGVGRTDELHSIAARAKLQSRNLFVQSLHSDTVEALLAQCQSSPAMPCKQRADRAEQIPMACIPGFVDGAGGTEELHGIAARGKLQSRNLFVRTTFSDTTEGLIVQCQSNLATPSEQRADRTERIAMACIPGSIDGVGRTEELHGIAARAKRQSPNKYVRS